MYISVNDNDILSIPKRIDGIVLEVNRQRKIDALVFGVEFKLYTKEEAPEWQQYIIYVCCGPTGTSGSNGYTPTQATSTYSYRDNYYKKQQDKYRRKFYRK